MLTCPGRSAARSSCVAVRCRAGAVTNSGVWYGPGSAQRHEECRTASGTGPSRIEHDNAAHGLAGLHRRKTLVDLRQFKLGRNPVLQMQLAAHVELDQPRHVDAKMVRAHRRALDFSLAQEIEAMQFDLLTERNHADDGRGAARR